MSSTSIPKDASPSYPWLLNFEQLGQKIAADAEKGDFKALEKFLAIVSDGEAKQGATLAKSKPQFCASLLPYIEKRVDQEKYFYSSTVEKAIRVFAKAGVFCSIDPSIKVTQVILHSCDGKTLAMNRLALQLQSSTYKSIIQKAKPDQDGNYDLSDTNDPALSYEALQLQKCMFENGQFPQGPWQTETALELCRKLPGETKEMLQLYKCNITSKFIIETVSDIDRCFEMLHLLKNHIGMDTYRPVVQQLFELLEERKSLESLQCMNARYKVAATLLEKEPKCKDVLLASLNRSCAYFFKNLPSDGNPQDIWNALEEMDQVNGLIMMRAKTDCLQWFCKFYDIFNDENGLLGIDILPFMLRDDSLGKHLQTYSELTIQEGKGKQVVESLALSRTMGESGPSPLFNIKKVYREYWITPEALEALKQLFPKAEIVDGTKR